MGLRRDGPPGDRRIVKTHLTLSFFTISPENRRNERECEDGDPALIFTDKLWSSGGGGLVFDDSFGLPCVFDSLRTLRAHFSRKKLMELRRWVLQQQCFQTLLPICMSQVLKEYIFCVYNKFLDLTNFFRLFLFDPPPELLFFFDRPPELLFVFHPLPEILLCCMHVHLLVLFTERVHNSSDFSLG